ncbi:hypothetical protein WY13_01845 [Clostridium ljungdahlii]|uniref:Uncharacterized protein n=1 Tax=Clostridium ljungdahlii TaxID=1538 RepID=A0A162KXL8_9CLOT|nr:hypothetical protein WY13_01845 [Clostridium ljungdahlii]
MLICIAGTYPFFFKHPATKQEAEDDEAPCVEYTIALIFPFVLFSLFKKLVTILGGNFQCTGKPMIIKSYFLFLSLLQLEYTLSLYLHYKTEIFP